MDDSGLSYIFKHAPHLAIPAIAGLKTPPPPPPPPDWAIPVHHIERSSKLLIHGQTMDDLGGSYRFTRISSYVSVRYRFGLVKVRRPSDSLILLVAYPGLCCPLPAPLLPLYGPLPALYYPLSIRTGSGSRNELVGID